MTSESIIFISDDSTAYKKFRAGETGTLLSFGSVGYIFYGIIRKADGTYVSATLDQFKKK